MLDALEGVLSAYESRRQPSDPPQPGRAVASWRPSPKLRAAPILAALACNGVEFVTVGSYAAILQDVDLPMTDIDIVPVNDPENRRRLVAALEDLRAKERVGDDEESIDDLRSDPDSIGDRTFRTFVTEYGGIDVVLRPAGFPRGYDDLVEDAHIATIQDDMDPALRVTAKVADVRDVYKSKQQAGRPKDIAALPAFANIHPKDAKGDIRRRYQDELQRRRKSDQS